MKERYSEWKKEKAAGSKAEWALRAPEQGCELQERNPRSFCA